MCRIGLLGLSLFRANCFSAEHEKQFLGSIGVSGEIGDFSRVLRTDLVG